MRIAWYRRDLRVDDAPALAGASRGTGETGVVALFVLDPRLVRASTMSPARLAYLCDALADLDAALRERGGRLVLREGDPAAVVPAVAREVQATQVHLSDDITPFAARRDAEVAGALEADGVAVVHHGGIMIREPGTVLTNAQTVSKVYSPFRRAWEALPLDPPEPAPARLRTPESVRSDPLPTTASLGVADHVPEGLISGGLTPAAERARRFLAERSAGYGDGRDRVGEDATSRLSADLHYGCVSARRLYHRLDRSLPGHDAFAQELIWRDFYGHVLHAWPESATQEFNADFRGIPWRGDGEMFRAWQQGRTGYPVVDAGLRQLVSQGWMHNRARMITASFLCKDLLVDWRLGVAHFMRHLVDGDVASNTGGWQWAAGTGTDAQPYFRIFNPVTQGEKFDPHGAYVRRFVPELADVPDKWLHHPWDMPAAVAAQAGVVIGRDYPEPLVDHAQARREALDFFTSHRRG